MLNPATDKYTVELSTDFYPKFVTEKYDKFLFHQNGPIKDIQGHIQESIQNLSTPGWSLNTLEIQGLPNLGANLPGNTVNMAEPTVSAIYPGTSALNDIFETKELTITFRNTILNWMYFYEISRNYYARQRAVKEFNINVVIMDAAEIDMLLFRFERCFVSGFPGLEFAFNSSFRESKTFDLRITFNELNVGFLLPDFNFITKGF